MGAAMREYFTKLTSSGQVTVPVEIRRHLGIRIGDRVGFCIGEDGRVQLRPATYPTIASLRGAGTLPQQLAWDDMLASSLDERLLELYGTAE
jgi:AbrB family looped-hinge helix DNA binding protein